eukprot:6699763-Ditylum_brightwellii.AAC.2
MYDSDAIKEDYTFKGLPNSRKVILQYSTIGAYAEILKDYTEYANPQEEEGFSCNIAPAQVRKRQTIELSTENFPNMETIPNK